MPCRPRRSRPFSATHTLMHSGITGSAEHDNTGLTNRGFIGLADRALFIRGLLRCGVYFYEASTFKNEVFPSRVVLGLLPSNGIKRRADQVLHLQISDVQPIEISVY